VTKDDVKKVLRIVRVLDTRDARLDRLVDEREQLPPLYKQYLTLEEQHTLAGSISARICAEAEQAERELEAM